jgi:hypothetical protein
MIPRNAGIVHQHVEPTMTRQHFSDRSLDARRIRHLERHCLTLPTRGDDLSRDWPGVIAARRSDHDRTSLGQLARNRATDPS